MKALTFFFLFQRTPIHYATWNGHIKIVEILGDRKADLNVKDFKQVKDFERTQRDGLTFKKKIEFHII